MTEEFSVLTLNIGSMYSPTIRAELPRALRDIYAQFFNYGRTATGGLELVAELICRHTPTVVCLQEARKAGTGDIDGQLEQLERMLSPQLPYRGFYGEAYGEESRALLLQNVLVNGSAPEKISTPDGIPIGIAYRIGAPDSWVASIHLRYSNLVVRMQQLEGLLRWADSKREPILLAGDFNTQIPWASSDKKQAAYRTFQLLREAEFQDLSLAVDYTWRWGRYLPTAGKIKLDHFFGRKVKVIEEPFTIKDHLRGWMDHLALFGPKFAVH